MLQYSFRPNAPPVVPLRELTAQPWIDYSSIRDRPKIRWKDGKRLALWICACVLHYEYMPPPDPWLNAWARMVPPDAMGYGRQEYGGRVGFWRVLRILDRLGVRATAIVNTEALQVFPDVAAAIKERSWDVVGHGMYNSRFIYGIDPAAELAYYRQMLDSVYDSIGVRMKGMGGPGPQAATENTPDLLAAAGFKFYTDFFLDEQPIPINVSAGQLIAMPYSVEVNDSPILASAYEADHFIDVVKRQFDRLYLDSLDTGRVMCVSIHPVLFGQPHRIRYLQDALEYVLSFDDVWIATGSEIADFFISNYLPAAAGVEHR